MTFAAYVPTTAKVRRVTQETADTVTIEFALQDRSRAWSVQPGQFNMLSLFGSGEVPISVSRILDRGSYEHTIRGVGRVTHPLIAVKRGDLVSLRGPYGTPWSAAAAKDRHAVLIAGGLGLAPLRPLLHECLARPKDYRSITLILGAREPQAIAFQKELTKLEKNRALHLLQTVDHLPQLPTRGKAWPWKGHVGVVTKLLPAAISEPKLTTAYICGPEVMMRFAAEDLIRCGVDAGSIYVSLERSMKCAVGVCGHCQLGQQFICRSGPVYPYPQVKSLIEVRQR